MSLFTDTLKRKLNERASELEAAIMRGYTTFDDYRFALARYREIIATLADMEEIAKNFADFVEEEDN